MNYFEKVICGLDLAQYIRKTEFHCTSDVRYGFTIQVTL